MSRFLSFHYLLLCALLTIATAERIKDKIYMSVDGVSACFRRHNGTHQFGCSSSRSGSVGVIHVVESEDDIKWLETNGTAGPYSVVMGFDMFTRNNLLRLRDTKNINGVLLAQNTALHRPNFYSPEDSCPNRYSGYESCDSANPWNPQGSSLLLEDWPFPMFFVHNDTLITMIKDCFNKHNSYSLDTQNQRSLCALEMNSFMFAALNSESCMRRSRSIYNVNAIQFCDPLGDHNVHWPVMPSNDQVDSVILVVTRMDSNSLYDELTPGAESSVTGLATFLATAFHLAHLNATATKTGVLFTLFNGEAFDYIGSSRFVYDLKNGNFHVNGKMLTLDRVKAVVELGQLGEGKLYLHSKNHEKFELVKGLEEKLNATIMSDSVPPVSAQSFLKAKQNVTTVVITNHGKQFVNKYYYSLLDNADSIGFNDTKSNLTKSLAMVAMNLGDELYKSMTGEAPPPGNLTLVENYVLNILSCYLKSTWCKLFRASTPPGTKFYDRALPLYVSVAKVDNILTIYTRQLLAFLTGTQLPHMNSSECHNYHLNWMGGYNLTGICVNSTVFFSEAISPAFIIDDYNMTSGLYSTWTESVWQTLNVRMFLKPPPATERLVAILGGSVALFSFILVWFISSRAEILFDSSRSVDL